MSVMRLIESAVDKDRSWARRAVALHDRHDPEAVAEVRAVYAAATSGDRSGGAATERLRALRLLRYLDEAGLACCECAPESACEIEEVS